METRKLSKMVASAALALSLVTGGAARADAWHVPTKSRHHSTWHRVSTEYADALAEGDLGNKPWERCIWRPTRGGRLIVCRFGVFFDDLGTS